MANGHFLLFILRQREKSAISVRKKHKFQTENKHLHKMFGKTLDSAAGTVTAAAFVVGVIVAVLKEKALPGKENDQAQQVKEILETSLSRIETLSKEQALEQIEKIYRAEAGLLAEEKTRAQNEQFEEKEESDNAEEAVRLKKLLDAIENN